MTATSCENFANLAGGTAAFPHPHLPTIAEMISPVKPSEFFDVYWQKKPLLIRNSSSSSFSNSLFTIRDVDSVLCASAPNASEYDFFRSAGVVSRDEYTDEGNHVLINRLLSFYREGGTLRHTNIQKYLPKLHDLCNRLRAEFRADVEFDMWLTRQNTFPPYYHYDAYDIFVFHVHGLKRWKLFNAARVPFVEGDVGTSFTQEQLGDPVLDFVIEPGDVCTCPLERRIW